MRKMHISFIPYGRRDFVEYLLKQMECQKHNLIMRKDKDIKYLFGMESQLRQMPFGIYDYICPKEDMDAVLTTLTRGGHHSVNFKHYVPEYVEYLGFKFDTMKLLRMLAHAQPIPKDYNKEKVYPWIFQNVEITIIGIKADPDIVGTGTLDNGWTHEAI